MLEESQPQSESPTPSVFQFLEHPITNLSALLPVIVFKATVTLTETLLADLDTLLVPICV